jgi:large subunit ribosomal protein L9
VVDVKPGYARNYLLPRGLAYEASADNLARIEQEQQEKEERARRDYLEARRRASQLEGQVLVFVVKAGEEGKLFGSVTTAPTWRTG